MKTLGLGHILAISLISIGISLSCAETVGCENDSSWYRVLNLSAPVNPRFEPFEIVGIGSEQGNHLVGRFFYFNYKEGDKSPPPVTIKGSKKLDDTFWPRVTAQVSNDINAHWTAIESPATPGETASLTIAAKPNKEEFYVELDVFRPMIGKMKYGKVILETGDSTIFENSDLLPPKSNAEMNAEKEERVSLESQ